MFVLIEKKKPILLTSPAHNKLLPQGLSPFPRHVHDVTYVRTVPCVRTVRPYSSSICLHDDRFRQRLTAGASVVGGCGIRNNIHQPGRTETLSLINAVIISRLVCDLDR